MVEKQKTKRKETSRSKTLKKAKKHPKKLSVDEAKAIERYHLLKENNNLTLKLLELEEKLANETYKGRLLSLKILRLNASEKHSGERLNYNGIVDKIKLRFGVDDFKYDPETLWLEDQS